MGRVLVPVIIVELHCHCGVAICAQPLECSQVKEEEQELWSELIVRQFLSMLIRTRRRLCCPDCLVRFDVFNGVENYSVSISQTDMSTVAEAAEYLEKEGGTRVYIGPPKPPSLTTQN